MRFGELKLDEVSLAPHFSEVITRGSFRPGDRFNGLYWKAVETAEVHRSACGHLTVKC